MLLAALLSALLLQAGEPGPGQSGPKKPRTKEISAARLPRSVTGYIAENLPTARITRVIKQKRTPGAKYIVSVTMKTKHHTLIFTRDGELVNLDGKKLKGTRLKE
jgi:hypothetical protein